MVTTKKKPKRRRVSESHWRELRAAFLVGGELRALARQAGLNENTVLARAAREQWTNGRREALGRLEESRGTALSLEASGAGEQSLAITREGLLERHLSNMLQVASRLSDFAVTMPVETAFASVRNIDVADRMTRRNLGLDRPEPALQIDVWGSRTLATSFCAVSDEAAYVEEG